MNLRMAHQQVGANNHASAMAVMVPDCPMHAHAHAQVPADLPIDSQTDPSAGQPDHTKNCTSCDLCLPLAAVACARLDFVAFASEVKPIFGTDDFVSAALALTQKPPIF